MDQHTPSYLILQLLFGFCPAKITDQDGKLAGIFLINAQRFRRDQIARDRANNIFKENEKYWTPVPGSNLYLAAANLANYNIRYVEPSDIEFVEQELGTGVVITPLPPEGTEAET